MLESASRGVSGPEGRGYLLPVGCMLPGGRGVYCWGGVCSQEVSDSGVSAPGGCLLPEGGCLLPEGVLPQTCPPVNRMTDRFKNITLATTSLRLVMKEDRFFSNYLFSETHITGSIITLISNS